MENNDYNKKDVEQETLVEEPWEHQFESDEEQDQNSRAARHNKTKGSSLYTRIIFAVFFLIILVVGAWALLKGFNLLGGSSQQGSTTPAVPKLVLQSQTTTASSTTKKDEQSSSTVANSSTTQSQSSTTATTTTTKPVTGQGTYTIVSGDSAYSIASSFGMTVSEFYSLNGFTENTVLLPGQSVKVSSSTSSASTGTSTTTNTNSSVTTYTIQSGDSIYSIAQAHNMTASEFKQLNGLTDDSLLLPGDVVKVSVGQ